jgi:hypothetical protein
MKSAPILLFAALAWGQGPFRLETSIAMAGVEGRFDHLAVDAAGKRLFIAALGNNTLEVVDLAAKKRLQPVRGLDEPQGIAYAPDTRRIYVANGKDGKLRIYDAVSLQPAGEVEIGEDADNVRYDASRRMIWVAFTPALGAVNAAAGARAGEIRMGAHPESFQLEISGPRIFANVPGTGMIEVADREKKAIVARWPVKGASANYPMALDEGSSRLFTGCRKPARVLVFDTATGRETASFACPGDTDDLFFDAARKRLYVIGGEGFVEAFAQKSADEYRSLGRTATASGARTGLYSPDLNRLFVMVPHRGAQPAEVRIYAVE